MEYIGKVKLEKWGKTQTLRVVKTEYENNGRLFLGLLCWNGEPFADITENHPEIDDELLQAGLEKGKAERAIIDGDFIDLMGGERQAKIWLTDNIKNLLGGGDVL